MKSAAALAVVAALAIAGPASAQTVRCGQVISQDTKVENDLRDCPGAGLVIGANDITLDLNGHTIDGDDAIDDKDIPALLADIGIDNRAGHDGLEVRGGTVREFFRGLVLEGAADNALRELSVSGNQSQGIWLVRSDDNRIEDSSVTDSGGQAILVGSSDGNRILRTSVRRGGIALGLADNNRIEWSSVADAPSIGIFVSRSQGNRLSNNSISASNLAGIGLLDSHRNRVERNSLSRNLENGGIGVAGSDHNRIAGNSAVDNRFAGIHIFAGSDDNRVERNSVSRNGVGIRITPEPPSLLGGPDRPAERNVVCANRALHNIVDGIRIELGAGHSLLEHNRADKNGLLGELDDGIDVDDPGTTLRGNGANHNSDLGIEAVPGVIDAGGNRAAGNGNPLQCLNVFCR
jgi:parallel beta-helix repeat protein